MADPQAAGQGKEDDSIKVICRSVTSLYLEEAGYRTDHIGTSINNTRKKLGYFLFWEQSK